MSRRIKQVSVSSLLANLFHAARSQIKTKPLRPLSLSLSLSLFPPAAISRKTRMLREVEGLCRVMVPVENLERNGLVSQSTIATSLMKKLSDWKATEDLGYFLAVTRLKGIGKGKFEESSRCILFPVAFCCRTFLPVNREIMIGVVRAVSRSGVFLKCGPMKYVYLSASKMPNYHYADGQNPAFLSDTLSRIEDGVVIRFMVFGVRWTQKKQEIEREFMILASLDGDSLGPVSLPGSDELDL